MGAIEVLAEHRSSAYVKKAPPAVALGLSEDEFGLGPMASRTTTPSAPE